MPEFQFQSAGLVLNFQTGVDAEGEPVYKKATYRNVVEQATAEQLQNVAAAIDGLTSYTVINVEKTEKHNVI